MFSNLLIYSSRHNLDKPVQVALSNARPFPYCHNIAFVRTAGLTGSHSCHIEVQHVHPGSSKKS